MNRAEATIGFAMNSKATKVTGGIVTSTSVASAFGSSVLGTIYGATYGAAIFATVGILGAWLGIIILDEKNGDLNFMPLSDKTASQLKISKSELEIYNSEVEELNIVKEVIGSQVDNDVTEAEVTDLWNHYKVSLSPETMKVASKIVQEFFNNKISLVK